MTEPYSDLHASTVMRSLCAIETTVLAPQLNRVNGTCGLCVGAASRVQLPPTPLLDAWVHLVLGPDGLFHGDMRARSDEPLPFGDDTVRVVVLSHVLEWTPHAAQLLAEVTRVLAPNGLVAVTGFHPLTAWWPWLLWRARACDLGFSVIAPMWLRSILLRHDIDMQATHRFGPVWPICARDHVSRVGGCYLMLGRKRRQAITPLHLRDAHSRALVRSTLAAGAQRECA